MGTNHRNRLTRLPPPDDLAGVPIPRAEQSPRQLPGAARRRFWRGMAEVLLIALLFSLASLILMAAGGLAWLSVRNAETLREHTVALNGLIDRQSQTQALLIRGGLAQSSDFLSERRSP